MIDPNELLTHLQAHLGRHTAQFSNTITPSGVTVAGTTLTVQATAHGLNVNDPIAPSGSTTFRNAISGAQHFPSDDVVRFTCGEEHDLTEPKLIGDPRTLVMAGWNESEWNGEHQIDAIPNRNTFEIIKPTAAMTNTPTGSGYLVETRPAGAFGVLQVATVPDPNSFTVDVSGVPNFPTGTVDGLTFVSAIRIAGAATLDDAVRLYASRADDTPEPWLFLIITSTDVSKDRNTQHDGVAGFTKQDLVKQVMLQNFSTIAFMPTEGDASRWAAQVTAQTELFRALASTLYGLKIDDPESCVDFVVAGAGHSPADVGTDAIYAHVYDWQLPSTVTYMVGFGNTADVAWRDFNASWTLTIEDVKNLLDPLRT